MACDAQTLLSSAAASGYYGLDERGLNLCVCGVLSAAQGNVTASAAMLAGKAYQNLNDQQLDDAISAHLCALLT